ncbi:MAG: polysaccharide deacetylase family protein [Flavobacteriales bacterium]|jgi:peptidoglycan/xylan/chitin deacetylase (PgdA/CDA1 family)|nr:polysaccharide deacetylase family protein [Flavobacteriales bacterium]
MRYWVKTPTIFKRLFPKIVWNFSEKEQKVFLTFDDGPSTNVTDSILTILEQEKVRATFFCIGKNVKKNPELADKILKKGHSIGNHSMTHVNGWRTRKNSYLRNINDASEYINSNLFRPPFGRFNLYSLDQILKKYKLVMWDVLSGDFDEKIEEKAVINNVIKNVANGSIIVFHDNNKSKEKTLSVLIKTIKKLKEKGFSFEAIPFNPVR